jgi:hypothetical protein
MHIHRQMVSSEFTIVDDWWKRAAHNVLLSRLGLVSITVAGECLIKVLHESTASTIYHTNFAMI